MKTRFLDAWRQWLRHFIWTVQSTPLLVATGFLLAPTRKLKPDEFATELVVGLVSLTTAVLFMSLLMSLFAYHRKAKPQVNPQDKPSLSQYFFCIVEFLFVVALVGMIASGASRTVGGGEGNYWALEFIRVGITSLWFALLIVLLSWRRVSRQIEGASPQGEQILSP